MNKFFKIALIGLFAIGVSDNLFSVDFQVGGIFYRVESLEKMTCIVCRPGNDISPVSVRYRERNIVIPQNVEYKGKDFTVVGIDNSAFRYCSELISITIPSTVEHIGEYAFSECKHLATVKGELNASIGTSAFSDCEVLRSISINSCTYISAEAFRGCLALSSVSIPGNIEKIGSYAFADCGIIDQVVLQDGEGILKMEIGVFSNSAPTDFYIGRNLRVRYSEFYKFKGISNLVFGDTVETIIGDGVTPASINSRREGIDEEAWRELFDLEELKSVTFGKKLKKFPALQNARLVRIICRSVLPPEVDGTFSNYSILNAQVSVPAGQRGAYESAQPWKNFSIKE